MEFSEIKNSKNHYADLLLLADEQLDMIEKYLHRGRMFVLKDPDVRAECVVTDEGRGVLEIKNIAVYPQYQRQGYGKRLIEFIEKTFADDFDILQVGTGDSLLTVPFYENCGFKKSYAVKNFFTDNYHHPIFEAGIQLVDMIYLSKKI